MYSSPFYYCWRACWRALARQLSDVRLKTCTVDCVFYVRAFRGACDRTWKYRSISGNSPAQLEIKDTINEINEVSLKSFHEGHERFSNDSRGRRDFYVFGVVFGCSIDLNYVSNFADSRRRCQDID